MTTTPNAEIISASYAPPSEPAFPKTPSRAEAGSKRGHSYRPLQTHFQRDGFNYRQIAREEGAAIYEQTRAGIANPSVGYEVIRIRRREGFHIHGRFVEAAEVYPNSEAWGVDGFTLTDKSGRLPSCRRLPVITDLIGFQPHKNENPQW